MIIPCKALPWPVLKVLITKVRCILYTAHPTRSSIHPILYTYSTTHSATSIRRWHQNLFKYANKSTFYWELLGVRKRFLYNDDLCSTEKYQLTCTGASGNIGSVCICSGFRWNQISDQIKDKSWISDRFKDKSWRKIICLPELYQWKRKNRGTMRNKLWRKSIQSLRQNGDNDDQHWFYWPPHVSSFD